VPQAGARAGAGRRLRSAFHPPARLPHRIARSRCEPRGGPAHRRPDPPAHGASVDGAREGGSVDFLRRHSVRSSGHELLELPRPGTAFSGNNGSVTGVARGSRPAHFARRNAPSVLYLKFVPPFHFALEDDDDVEESPFGGLTWSGRADTVAEFVRLPLFDADEMNNKSEAEIAGKLRAAPLRGRPRPGVPRRARHAGVSHEGPRRGPAGFSHQRDDVSVHLEVRRLLAPQGPQLSPLEMKGLTAFESRAKGACNHCHLMYEHSTRPESSLFTTYAYDAVGVPRNRAIAANADPKRYDLGLCERTQKKVPSSDAKWCGSFRIPSLRNVAVRQRFMHNGVFSKLRDVVAFYATRSTNPDLWYPHGAKFDDLPDRYRRQREHAFVSLQPARGRSAGYG
jgi:cytochrome c peroxidase